MVEFASLSSLCASEVGTKDASLGDFFNGWIGAFVHHRDRRCTTPFKLGTIDEVSQQADIGSACSTKLSVVRDWLCESGIKCPYRDG